MIQTLILFLLVLAIALGLYNSYVFRKELLRFSEREFNFEEFIEKLNGEKDHLERVSIDWTSKFEKLFKEIQFISPMIEQRNIETVDLKNAISRLNEASQAISNLVKGPQPDPHLASSNQIEKNHSRDKINSLPLKNFKVFLLSYIDRFKRLNVMPSFSDQHLNEEKINKINCICELETFFCEEFEVLFRVFLKYGMPTLEKRISKISNKITLFEEKIENSNEKIRDLKEAISKIKNKESSVISSEKIRRWSDRIAGLESNIIHNQEVVGTCEKRRKNYLSEFSVVG